MKIEAGKKYRCIRDCWVRTIGTDGYWVKEDIVYTGENIIKDFTNQDFNFEKFFELAEESKTIVSPEISNESLLGDKEAVWCQTSNEVAKVCAKLKTYSYTEMMSDYNRHLSETCYTNNGYSSRGQYRRTHTIITAQEYLQRFDIKETCEESEPKVYILLKDLPDLKAGGELTKRGNMYDYVSTHNRRSGFHKSHVENNSEWFLPKKVEPKEFTESDMIELAKDTQRTYYGCKEGAERGAIEWINKKRRCSNTA